MKADLEINGEELVLENETADATCKSELCEGASELIVKADWTEEPVVEVWIMKPREDSQHYVDYLEKNEGDKITGKVEWNDFLWFIDGDDTRIGFNSKRIPRVDFIRVNIPVRDVPQFTISGYGMEVEDEKHKTDS